MKYRLIIISMVFSMGVTTGVYFSHPDESSHQKQITIQQHVKKPLISVAPVLEKEAITIIYDGRFKNPHCVIEELTHDRLQGSADRAKHQFKADEALPEHLRATLSDYKGSGLDRGHLSPAANNKQNVRVMRESFLLTNICPQEPTFNRNYWAFLESHVRALTEQYQKVTVISGPLYVPQGESGERYVHFRVIGPNDVGVPTHFFKVLKLEDAGGQIHKRAYILPNEPIPARTPLEQFQESVEKVERLAGIILNFEADSN